jgi:hypothetical protein
VKNNQRNVFPNVGKFSVLVFQQKSDCNVHNLEEILLCFPQYDKAKVPAS